MHLTIGAIVYADNEETARHEASDVFDNLVRDSDPFDRYQILDSMRANSPEGQKLVASLMLETKEYFIGMLNELRRALAGISDEVAFSVLGEHEVRWKAYQIGKYVGPGIYLYYQGGFGIRLQEDLDDILTLADRIPSGVLDWTPEKKTIPDDVWIVLADAHY